MSETAQVYETKAMRFHYWICDDCGGATRGQVPGSFPRCECNGPIPELKFESPEDFVRRLSER